MHFSITPHDELRVPVDRRAVELYTELDRYASVVFLAPGTRPEELFCGDDPFFPAEENGKVRLFARAALVRVVEAAGDGAPASLAALGIPYDAHGVVVRFRSGRVLTGLVMSLSADIRGARSRRMLDVVNEQGASFSVHADGRVHHVAKAHVAWIQELA